MTAEAVGEGAVYSTLTQIKHPEIEKRNLVELGMIGGVRIDGKKVVVTLVLPYTEVPIKDELVQSIRHDVSGMGPDLDVDVDTTVMDAKQRDMFLAQVKEEQAGSPSASQIGRVLADMSGKGGVVKSSVAGLFASALRAGTTGSVYSTPTSRARASPSSSCTAKGQIGGENKPQRRRDRREKTPRTRFPLPSSAARAQSM